MSSPHLNNLIIVGCMLTYSSVIFLGLDSQLSSETAFPYICTARAWLLMAGFSLAFGSMFSKTWRVHSIFTDVKLNKKVSLIVLPARRFYAVANRCGIRFVCLGDKRLPIVHGGRCIIVYWSGYYDDLAGCGSILPRNETNGTLCKRTDIDQARVITRYSIKKKKKRKNAKRANQVVSILFFRFSLILPAKILS